MGGRVARRYILLVLSLLLALLFLQSVVAVGIGVNRAKISYDEVLQNGYAQEQVLVTTDSEEPIIGMYEFEGSVAPWLRVEPDVEYFEFSKDAPYQLTVIVEPPPDARLQEYSGGVRVLTGEIDRSSGGLIGTTTRAAFLIKLLLGVTGTERLECRIGGVQIKDTEIGEPYDFLATVVNKGNVRISPEFIIQVYDQYQENLVQNVTVPINKEVLPTVTQEFVTQVLHELPPGQYWVRVKVPLCGESAFLTFDVLDRGGISDKGELLQVQVSPWAKTGDIVPIQAIFKNLGSRTVNAKFKGTITTSDEGKLVKVIDTDLYNVPPGQTAEIETFFNPTAPGRYIIAGRVLYNNKLTFQKSAILNVQGQVLAVASAFGGPLLLILFIIVILLLLILIAKRRRRRSPRRVVRR